MSMNHDDIVFSSGNVIDIEMLGFLYWPPTANMVIFWKSQEMLSRRSFLAANWMGLASLAIDGWMTSSQNIRIDVSRNDLLSGLSGVWLHAMGQLYPCRSKKCNVCSQDCIYVSFQYAVECLKHGLDTGVMLLLSLNSTHHFAPVSLKSWSFQYCTAVSSNI